MYTNLLAALLRLLLLHSGAELLLGDGEAVLVVVLLTPAGDYEFAVMYTTA